MALILQMAMQGLCRVPLTSAGLFAGAAVCPNAIICGIRAQVSMKMGVGKQQLDCYSA